MNHEVIMEGSETTEREQAVVLLNAFAKFKERNAHYQDNWRKFGIGDAALHCVSKASRLEAALHRLHSGGEINDQDVDDALDLINYAAFFVRHVKEGRLK